MQIIVWTKSEQNELFCWKISDVPESKNEFNFKSQGTAVIGNINFPIFIFWQAKKIWQIFQNLMQAKLLTWNISGHSCRVSANCFFTSYSIHTQVDKRHASLISNNCSSLSCFDFAGCKATSNHFVFQLTMSNVGSTIDNFLWF